MTLFLRILGIGAVLLALYIIVGEQLVGTSGDAFVNARVATVRAPLTGRLQLSPLSVGTRLQDNDAVGGITTRRAATAELDSLLRARALEQADADALDAAGVPPGQADWQARYDRERAQNRVSALQTLIQRQQSSIGLQNTTAVATPIGGIVWSIGANDSEYVVEGEPLMTVADCGGAFIHASVDQNLYNRLRIGDAAQFRFHGGETMPVTVALLAGTGPRTLLETLAISPTQRQLEGYAVLLTAPELAADQACPLGRTGRVLFNGGPLGGIGNLLPRLGF